MLTDDLKRIIAEMRNERPRYKSHDLGYVDSVSASNVDDWADELEAFVNRGVDGESPAPASPPPVDPPQDDVLQAVLDAISGKLDPSTQIADHPNVKFAQMERLKLLQTWLSIETAPQDGRAILIWEPRSDGERRFLEYKGCDDKRYAVGYWRTWAGSWGNRNAETVQPTHWMSLPLPPIGDRD